MSLLVALGMSRRPVGDWLLPLERIAAIVLPGSPSLETTPVIASLIGLGVHLLLSAVYGVLFAVVVAVPMTRWRAYDLVPTVPMVAAVYGFVLWAVNYYAMAPQLGWDWFPFQTNLGVQAAAHVLGFGLVLGLLLAHRLSEAVSEDAETSGRGLGASTPNR